MAWKDRIRRVCKDFCIPMEVYDNAVNAAENNKSDIPLYYHGNYDKFKYDIAYRIVREKIRG